MESGKVRPFSTSAKQPCNQWIATSSCCHVHLTLTSSLLSLSLLFQTKSQPSLLPRRVSYTDLQAAALPRTQSLYSKHSLASTAATMATNLPAITSRPGSSRPGSRPMSRMESRITSRPPSRMMDRQQQQQHQQQQTDPVQVCYNANALYALIVRQ